MDETSFKDKDEKVLYYAGFMLVGVTREAVQLHQAQFKTAGSSQFFSAPNANTDKATIESLKARSCISL